MTKKAVVRMVVARIFFPVILLWDAFKFCMNYCFGRLFGRLILRTHDLNAECKNYDDNFRKTTLQNLDKKGFSAQYWRVITHDGVSLDTLEIKQKNVLPPAQQKYVLNFLGNRKLYEQVLDEMEEDARRLDCNVLGFNLRGGGWSQSSPRSKQDLVTDGIAQVQRLLDQGVNSENIILKGFSLGGGVATAVAKHFLDHNIKLNLFNDRSFSSLTNTVVGFIRKANWFGNGHHESGWKKLLGWIAFPLVRLVFALLKWEINAADAYKKLPDTHKELMCIRSPRPRKEENYDDALVTHWASLYAALKPQRKQEKAKLDVAIKAATTHTVLHKLNQQRKMLKARKMIVQADAPDKGNGCFDPHCASRNYLKDRYQGQTGADFFITFAKRAYEHHQAEKQKTPTTQQTSPSA
jgi:pimeloyl-ACP methyl ester carboxylesterase